jgi:hypothetical protein
MVNIHTVLLKVMALMANSYTRGIPKQHTKTCLVYAEWAGYDTLQLGKLLYYCIGVHVTDHTDLDKKHLLS